MCRACGIPSGRLQVSAAAQQQKPVSEYTNTEKVRAFVEHSYETILGRKGDPEGINNNAGVILSGKTIACTACNYCGPGCPQNIPIPKYFSLYNGDKMEIIGKSWTPNRGLYQKLTESFGKASDCIACGQCENMCPQHLPIIEYLKDVAAYMENA